MSRAIRVMNVARQFRADRSAALLLLSNLVTIVFAVVQKWDVHDVLWIYWGQSIIIGGFNCRRMLDLKQFSTEGVKLNDQPVQPTRRTQRQMAGFFALHYGGFHLVYMAFLFSDREPLSRASLLGIGVCLLTFLVNHAFSYRHNRQQDMGRTPNIGTMMLLPYARVIPMHLVILFGGFLMKYSAGRLVLFLVLKTAADVIMHMAEHADARGEQTG